MNVNNSNSKIASFTLLFLPFLAPYRLPGTNTNFQTLFLLLVPVLLFFKGGHKLLWPNRYMKLFVAYACIIPLYGYFLYNNWGSFLSCYVPIITFTFAYLVFLPFIKWDLIVKYYRKLAVVSIVFFFVQEIMYRIVGWRVVGVLPFMPFTRIDMSMTEYISRFSVLSRSASLFIEPAHFSQYIAGFLALELGLLDVEKKFFNKYVLISTFSLFLTFSGSAYVLAILLWSLHLIKSNVKIVYKIFVVTVGLIGCIYLMNNFAETEQGEKIINRATSLSTQDYGESENIRIYRGWMVYETMPSTQRIIGIGGSANISNFINNRGLHVFFDDNERYVNNAQCLAIGYGYLGVFMFLIYILSLVNKKRCHSIYYVSIFCILCFFESFWCTPLMLIYLLLPRINMDCYDS